MRRLFCFAGALLAASIHAAQATPGATLPFGGVAPGCSETETITLHATNNLAGFQCDILFDAARLVCTNVPTLVSGPSGVIVDGAQLQSGLYRLLAYSPTGVALTNDVTCNLTFSAPTNADNGQAPLTGGNTIFGNANAVAISPTGTVTDGLILVGDAFGFMPGGGRAQFIGTSDSNYIIQASTNLNSWTGISTNAATNGLAWTMDTNALVHTHRFYRSATTQLTSV